MRIFIDTNILISCIVWPVLEIVPVTDEPYEVVQLIPSNNERVRIS